MMKRLRHGDGLPKPNNLERNLKNWIFVDELYLSLTRFSREKRIKPPEVVPNVEDKTDTKVKLQNRRKRV
jgi:hypothetical protein